MPPLTEAEIVVAYRKLFLSRSGGSETRVHYEDYPYPPPRSFVSLRRLRHPSWPNASRWIEWFPGDKEMTRKRVLVVGCGTEEAVLVAAQEPLLDVVGIDHSLASVERARRMAELEKIENVELVCTSLAGYVAKPFDAVLCHGVLHHIHDADSAVSEMLSLAKRDAPLSVMVYGVQSRWFISQFCEMIRRLGFGPNAEGVSFVRGLMRALPRDHPARVFFDATDRRDEQIVDTWLHPYFRQYRASELVTLVERHGFRFRWWTTPDAVSTSILEQLGDDLTDMSELERADVGQVINCADAQLGAMFVAI